jgi:hypothetical protein
LGAKPAAATTDDEPLDADIPDFRPEGLAPPAAPADARD